MYGFNRMRGFGGRGRDMRAEGGDEGGRGRFGGGPFGHGGGFGHGHGHGGHGRGFGRGGGGFGGFGGFGGEGGPRGRRGKRFEGEELRLMVLGLLESAPQHGYQLIRAFAEKSGDAYQPSPGVLYPLLTMLADMELVAEVSGASAGGRRSYELAPAGRAEVETRRAEIDALFARLAQMAEAAQNPAGAPLRRAMGNLVAAFSERMQRPDATTDTAFEIARLIDEATQKIERL